MPTTPVTWLDDATANITTAGSQFDPDILQLTNGNFLVSWTTSDAGGLGSPNGNDIFGQLFNAAGQRIGVEFRLNQASVGDDEQHGRLAALPNGGFIVAYHDLDNPSSTPAGGSNIRLEEYNADGTIATSNALVVNDSGAGALPNFRNPTVAVSSATSAMIVYEREASAGIATVVGKIYNPATDTYGAEFTLLSSAGGVTVPEVATLTNGNYVVVGAYGASDTAIVYRIMDSAGGTVLGASFVTGTNSNSESDFEPTVTALTGGGFVIAWTNTDTNDTDVLYRVYDSAGTQTASGTVDLVGAVTNNNNEPTVAALADGSFVVVYDNDATNVQQAQHVSALGVNLGTNFTYSGSGNQASAIGFSDGRFASVFLNSSSEIGLEIMDTRDTPNSNIGGLPVAGTVNGETVTEANGVKQYVMGPGDDTLNVTSPINTDLHDGGPGTDTINWSAVSEVGARFNLQAGTAANSAGTLTEQMTNFENLVGTNNRDTIIGTIGINFLNGGGGDDNITGGDGIDNLTGGLGADVFRYTSASESPSGTGDQITDFTRAQGDVINLIEATPTAIGIVQSGAVSFIFASTPSGAMQINVTGEVEGSDIFTGGIGVTLQGDNTSTTLLGSASNDSIFGNGGNDTLIGSVGADVLFGGAGADTFKYIAFSESNAANSDLIADFATSVDKLDLSGANPTSIAIIDNGANSIVFANTAGGQIQIGSLGNVNGNDIIAGVGVTIQGGAASSLISGGNLSDYLFGEGGNDALIGGGGSDILFGGAGFDLFKYNAAAESNAAAPDLIADFQTGIDKIDLSSAGMTAAGIASNIVFASGPGGTMQIGSLQTITLADIILAPGPAPLEMASHSMSTEHLV